jgi:hypothetical protein
VEQRDHAASVRGVDGGSAVVLARCVGGPNTAKPLAAVAQPLPYGATTGMIEG